MTDVPPSRWQVVEQGRRLVVIDRLTGEAASGPPDPASDGGTSAPALPAGVVRQRDGGGTLTTHRLYDANGPRTITLDAAGATIVARVRAALVVAAMAFAVLAVGFPFALLVVPLLLLQPRVRGGIRGVATRWLDARATGAA